ncbi:protein aubergine-like isoform X1 [Sabethes cyaneus]|uniref:protein aubergine-like isoform X1 n=1 Tax=Sabethes cyaneus TaxID=53552 RepID=UPI00237D4763|nr:protein aubergine-like isoform X1 [Sabethes cyaneus]XP_053690464.1 protein aubergine-like isoform X1 [Sabethes cyaneus]
MAERNNNRGGRGRTRGFATAGGGGGGQRGGGGGRGQQRQAPPQQQAWPSLGQPAQPAASQQPSGWGNQGAQQQRTHTQPAQQQRHQAHAAQQQRPQAHAAQVQRPQAQPMQQQRPQAQPAQQQRPVQEPSAAPPVSDSEHRPQRGSTGDGLAGRGAMRGKRALPDVVRTRPVNSVVTKQGKTGQVITLQTNYFRVTRKENESIFQYRVDFNPPSDSMKILSSLMYQLKPILGGYIFEGTQLFSRHRFAKDEVEYTTRDGTTGQEYIISFRKVGTIDGTNEMALMIFNLINRKAMAGLNLQLIGRNFFDPEGKIRMGMYEIDLYPGYLTSIRQHEQDVLMCAEITHKVMRVDNCYVQLRRCMDRGGNWKDTFKRLIIGTIVMANYGRYNTYLINDVEFNTTPDSRFDTQDGPTTFIQYFKSRYNIDIRDSRQPMLISRSKPRDIRAGKPEIICLVPELVRATGITDEMRKDFKLMRDLADHTRLTPDRRIERLEAFNNRLVKTQASSEVFDFWKTELDRRLVEVPGRLLPQEIIVFDLERQGIPAGESADWQMAFRNSSMTVSIPLKNWFVIVPGGQDRLIADFINCLKNVSSGMRFQMQDPLVERIGNDSPAEYVAALSRLVERDPQLIMCLVSNDKQDRYAAIKKKCCVDRGVPTQVIKARTITPKGGNVRTLMSVATKVAIQINCKLGGIPWVIKNPLTSVMVVGFDVCHDTKDKAKSYGALVASMYCGNTKYPRFFSTVSHHSKGEELCDFMAINVVKALRSYQSDFGTLPMRIIFYRDGVGEGQFKYVYEHELNVIKRNLSSVYQGVEAKLSFFVVNKRINTRLFDQKKNPLPGTVVDDVITLPERNDFYLISQSVRQGTVSPTSYNILYDNTGLTADQLQLYTYKQTHLYYNWSGTVGVPAVCQYAHKLAFLVGQYLHQAPAANLEKKLYYL